MTDLRKAAKGVGRARDKDLPRPPRCTSGRYSRRSGYPQLLSRSFRSSASCSTASFNVEVQHSCHMLLCNGADWVSQAGHAYADLAHPCCRAGGLRGNPQI